MVLARTFWQYLWYCAILLSSGKTLLRASCFPPSSVLTPDPYNRRGQKNLEKENDMKNEII